MNSQLENIINSKDVTTQVMMITPKLAEEMLTHNTKNRPVSNKQIEKYIDSMKKGEWQLNGDSITFDSNANLLNGQHRLYAVVKSGCTIKSNVTGGVSPEAFSTYDNGRSRTLSQLIALGGAKHYTFISGIVVGYKALCDGTRLFANNGSKYTRKSNSEYMNLYNANEDKYNHYGLMAYYLAHRIKGAILNAGIAGSMWMYLVEKLQYPKEMVERFFFSVYSYDSCQNQTIDTLRKTLLKMGNTPDNKSHYSRSYIIDLIVKGWNLYATGQNVSRIVVRDNDRGAKFLSSSQVQSLLFN